MGIKLTSLLNPATMVQAGTQALLGDSGEKYFKEAAAFTTQSVMSSIQNEMKALKEAIEMGKPYRDLAPEIISQLKMDTEVDPATGRTKLTESALQRGLGDIGGVASSIGIAGTPGVKTVQDRFTKELTAMDAETRKERDLDIARLGRGIAAVGAGNIVSSAATKAQGSMDLASINAGAAERRAEASQLQTGAATYGITRGLNDLTALNNMKGN